MKYIKSLNIDFDNWNEVEDMESDVKLFMYYNLHVMNDGYRLCTIMKLNYNGLDDVFNVWDVDNRENGYNKLLNEKI